MRRAEGEVVIGDEVVGAAAIWCGWGDPWTVTVIVLYHGIRCMVLLLGVGHHPILTLLAGHASVCIYDACPFLLSLPHLAFFTIATILLLLASDSTSGQEQAPISSYKHNLTTGQQTEIISPPGTLKHQSQIHISSRLVSYRNSRPQPPLLRLA